MAPQSRVTTGHQRSPVVASQGSEAQTQPGRQVGCGQTGTAMGRCRLSPTDSWPVSFLFSAPRKPHSSLHVCVSRSISLALSLSLSHAFFPFLSLSPSLPPSLPPTVSPPHTLSPSHTDTHTSRMAIVRRALGPIPRVAEVVTESTRSPPRAPRPTRSALLCEHAVPLCLVGRVGRGPLGRMDSTSQLSLPHPGPGSPLPAARKPGR